ncbi:CPCC family cysteine-rich protein [Streptomyces sp. NPDC127036]|uniref:CPCC family cysteine-rich protein n=1 Tax=Streptomyces sp. NPDC127036 TaxID=3347112 RepID=UPI003654EFE1
MAERAAYEICPVCFWEDDGQDEHDASEVRGGPNRGLSLRDPPELPPGDRRVRRALYPVRACPHYPTSTPAAARRTARGASIRAPENRPRGAPLRTTTAPDQAGNSGEARGTRAGLKRLSHGRSRRAAPEPARNDISFPSCERDGATSSGRIARVSKTCCLRCVSNSHLRGCSLSSPFRHK